MRLWKGQSWRRPQEKRELPCKEVFIAWFWDGQARCYTACPGGQEQALVPDRLDELLI